MPDAIDIWCTARELVPWRGTGAPQYVAQKAAKACNENAWAFWFEVDRAIRELLREGRAAGRDAALTRKAVGWFT